jgi:methylglutaconyl-CoA hydratase
MSRTEVTLYEVVDGAAWITLNSPSNRNVLSAQLVGELFDHLNAALADPAARAVVITGAGPAFCAGADLKSAPGGERRASLVDVMNLMLDSPKPVITAINGSAFAGGLGLVGAADIVVTAEEAQFSFSEVRIGAIPAVISVVCIPKLGATHAARLFMTGERFSGQKAVELGLATQAVPAEGLRAAVQEQVELIRLGAPGAIAEAKTLVRRIATLSTAEGFAEAQPWTARVFAGPEAAEGIAAFKEKRRPSWADQK